MFGYIKGKITKLTPKCIILENASIGYQIIVPNPYNFKIGDEVTIYTYLHVREDLIELYGFKSEDQKDLFLKLISVSGIGPKSALSMLATGSVNEIVSAIEARNDVYLKKFPGIGAKASQQIILDLRGKLNFQTDQLVNLESDSKLNDVVEALVALGYSKKDAEKVTSQLDSTKEVGVLVKEALKKMVK